MEPTHVKRLKDEHSKGLQLCQEKTDQWLKFKADYEALKERLETLPNSISYDVTVPFGMNAFTMGKIVHTNEVMVLLGDNWFAEVSAMQAAAIADRRLKQCAKMLTDLEKEKEQYHNWMNYIDEISANNEGLVEIVEKFDDEEEKLWREQHAKNVKAYRQKLARERKNSNGESTASNSDDEYRQRLESLELTEEDSEAKSEDGSTFDYSDDTSQLSEDPSLHPNKTSLKLQIPNRERHDCEIFLGRTLSFDSGTEDGSPRSTGVWEENGKHVRWQDLSRQNIKRITFKHTKRKKSLPIKCQSPESLPDEPQPLIQSPSDIYKQFGSFFPASPPKSILKVKHSPTPPDNDDPPEFPSNSNTAFTGEVYEHSSSSPVHVVEKKSSRPVSQFKNSRKNRKK